jgi:hypothetical protein
MVLALGDPEAVQAAEMEAVQALGLDKAEMVEPAMAQEMAGAPAREAAEAREPGMDQVGDKVREAPRQPGRSSTDR